jgi:hypothetical protein
MTRFVARRRRTERVPRMYVLLPRLLTCIPYTAYIPAHRPCNRTARDEPRQDKVKPSTVDRPTVKPEVKRPGDATASTNLGLGPGRQPTDGRLVNATDGRKSNGRTTNGCPDKGWQPSASSGWLTAKRKGKDTERQHHWRHYWRKSTVRYYYTELTKFARACWLSTGLPSATRRSQKHMPDARTLSSKAASTSSARKQ